MMTENYLARLNPEQRHAVEHSGDQPLLIVAGAGSGKTDTLAHRVAHLIVQRADPRRILLTFSRRAAAEMSRRVERIAVQVLPEQGRLMVDALTWSGTFHAIGNRLLREYCDQIGLDRAFTIHDRADSADLINLVRHDLGLSKTEKRFPTKNTCLAIYSQCRDLLGRGIGDEFSLVRRVGRRAQKTIRQLRRNQATAEPCSIMMTFSSTGRK